MTDPVRVPDVVSIAVTSIGQVPGNPNVMDPDEYALLKETIRRVGFLQPILVRPVAKGEAKKLGVPKDGYVLVDGEHRLTAGTELGMAEVPAVVVEEGADIGQALRIGMNRLRGRLDLTTVSRELDDLLRQSQRDPAELQWLTGFTTVEIDQLVRKASQHDVDDLLQQTNVPSGDAPDIEDNAPRSFALRIVFESEADRATVRAALLRAAGPDGTMAAGLLALAKGEA